jgi:excisionase family DNA binding protein
VGAEKYTKSVPSRAKKIIDSYMTNQAKITNAASVFSDAFFIGIRQIIREELQAVIKPTSLPRPYDKPRRINKPYLSVKEAAKIASLGPSTVRLYIRKGKLKAHKVGRRVIIEKADLESFLRMNPTGILFNEFST